MKASNNPFPSILLDEQASAPTTPATGLWRVYAKSDGLYIVDDAGTESGPFSEAAGAVFDPTGWVAADAMTYASADDPTFTVTITGDQSAKYSVGMRIKLTQSTGGTKYFIITKIAVSTDTTLTLYGGTDYNLENEAISNPYYSAVKAPHGFPVDPLKWTVEVTDITDRVQTTPTQNTWYSPGSLSISIPIGVWNIYFKCVGGGYDPEAAAFMSTQISLSTANNSESDADFTVENPGGVSSVYYRFYLAVTKTINLTSKTSYYPIIRTRSTGVDNISLGNSLTKMIIRAVCAYL